MHTLSSLSLMERGHRTGEHARVPPRMSSRWSRAERSAPALPTGAVCLGNDPARHSARRGRENGPRPYLRLRLGIT